MQGINLLQMFLGATILTTATGTQRFLASFLPAFPIPTVEPTPEYSPPKPGTFPVCQLIIHGDQASEQILVCQASPTPTIASNNGGTKFSTLVKTTNTTRTEVTTVVTTTTTIEATTTPPLDVKSCTSQGGNHTQYNWWQCQTTISVGLLVSVTALLLNPVTTQSSEQPQSGILQIPPSSRSSREIEVPPEQTFIELSRTKKLSSVRSRPSSRNFRTSSSPPLETKGTPNPDLSSTQVATVLNTSTSQPTAVTTQATAPEGSLNVTNNQVRFTKTRAAKSGRGQVFTFTFKNPQDNSVKEQHTQSRIPARFSPVFTSQTPNRPGSVPEASSKTNQPDNLAINLGPPGDVPRSGQSGRALNLSDTAGQGNQISQETFTNTAPQNIGESSTADKLVPSFRPKSKTRPHKEPTHSLPGTIAVVPTKAVPNVQVVSESVNSPLSPRRRPLKEGLQRVLPNHSGISEELSTQPPRDTPDLSLQALHEGQNQPTLPAPPRIRYVKAGSLRFFPNRFSSPEDLPPQDAGNLAERTAQPPNEGIDPSEQDNYPQPRRPTSQYRSSRTDPEGFLQGSPANLQDFPSGTNGNYVESTPQASTSNKENGPSERDFSRTSPQPNQPLKQGPLRLQPANPVNSQKIPPELARDFANLQNLLASRDSARFSSPALQRPQRPLNLESLRFLPNSPDYPHELPLRLRTYFKDPGAQPLSVNEGQAQLPQGSLKQSDRPTKVTSLSIVPNNADSLEQQARQTLLRNFGGPAEPNLRGNPGSLDRQQELSRSNRPQNERLAIFVPIGSQGLSFQQARELADPGQESLIENEGKVPIRQEVVRINRPLNLGAPRFQPNDPRRLPSQQTYYNSQSLVRQEYQGADRPQNEETLRVLTNDPQRIPPLSTNDFVDQTLPNLRENEETVSMRKESLRTNRPPSAGTQRFLVNDPQGLPHQAINYADPNIQRQIENERQALARLRPNIPQLGSLRLEPNDQVLSGEQLTSSGRDTANLNFQNTPVNVRAPLPTADSPIQLQRAHQELDINSLSNAVDRPSQLPPTQEPLVRSQANQQFVPANRESNPTPNTARPTDPPSPPPAADSSARVQQATPTTIPNPGFSINPPTNIPRLIIEFPSSSSGNDQSIRLQLNPNSAPANAPTPANPQLNIPKMPSEVRLSSGTSHSPNNQPKQQSLSSNSAIANSPHSNLPQRPSLPITASIDSLQTLTNQQTSNPALATNLQVVQQKLPSQLPALSVTSGDSTSFQPTDEIPKTPDSQSNVIQPSVQSSTLSEVDTLPQDQYKSHLFPANFGTINSNSNPQGPTANSHPALLGTPLKGLHPNSQSLSSTSLQHISPLSKTLAFPNQRSPQQSPLKSPSNHLLSNPLSPSSNPVQQLNSLPNSPDPVQQLSPVTRDSSSLPSPNSQILSNVGSSVNSLSDNPASLSGSQTAAVREPPIHLAPISQDLTETERAHSSPKSQEKEAQLKLSTTDSPSKSNAQVPPVDVRLTINFNANIPGFPSQLQQPSNPTLTAAGSPNNTQYNAQPSPQELSSPIPPNLGASLTRPELNPQFQPVTTAPINFPATPSGLPAELLAQAGSSSLRSQSNFQIPNNFSPSYSPQFDVRGLTPVTQGSSIRTQPSSHFFNANVNSQFNPFGRQFDLRSLQSPTVQEQLVSFNQNSQFTRANVVPQIRSQFNIPGKPFEVRAQQTLTQDLPTRFQPRSQFQTTNSGSINAQFNNVGFNTPQQHFTQASPTRLRPVPQVFTANAGLAVNSLSYSPGPSVELLPPVTGESSNSYKRSELSNTNEQLHVSFLENSPELSAELLPPIISSISAQSANPQAVQAPSTLPPVTTSPSTSFDQNPQFVPVNVGQIPKPPIELLPPLDPFFPQFSQNPYVKSPPSPIDIPKPLVPALVPPPRERITIPIDIPRPAVPALVPPPRERIETPIDIPKPDVPALVPPPRERTELPIDIPRPDVPALVPPPRPSELAVSARFLPPAPTSFTFNPPGVSQQGNVPNLGSRPLNSNANFQSQQTVQTSTDNPVLILPKSSSRLQGRSNNPLSIEDLSKRVGFLPQNPPAPFSPPANPPTTSTPTRIQSQTDSVFQITDIRAGRLQPIAQEVLSSNTPPRPHAPPQTTFLRSPVSLGLPNPLFPTSGSSSQQSAFDSLLSSEHTKTTGQSSITERLTLTTQTPTQTLLPPVSEAIALPKANTPGTNPFPSTFTPGFETSLTSSAKSPVVNPKASAGSPGRQTSPQPQQTLVESPQEGFIIFQTPALAVASQTNRPDSHINVTVVTQGGTGNIKPNTTLTAEPVRPVNRTLSPDPQLPTPPLLITSTVPDLPSSLLPPLNERTSTTPINSLLPPLDTGFVRNNFTSNPFTPPFSLPQPLRFSKPNAGPSPGTSAACPTLDLQHKGHRAPQISGHLILSPGFYPIDDPSPTRCDNRGGIDGKKINWWQILLNHGGEPSTLSRANESGDAKIPTPTNPCIRPFETEGFPVFYNTTKTDSKTYYREEIAYHRFPESKNTFLESRGLFVWAQAKSSLDSAAYLVLYTRDDSGFWLQVKSVNCQFDRDTQPNLQCQSVPECFCEGGKKQCIESVPVLTRNFPVKTFRF